MCASRSVYRRTGRLDAATECVVAMPNPTLTSTAAIIPLRNRMSEADYDSERAKIAPDKDGAVARWEQELAVGIQSFRLKTGC